MDLRRLSINPQLKVFLLIDQFSIISMRKLILQIRHTIFSRFFCVRHLQTILSYSSYLHGIFAFYSNFSPPTRIYFCKRKVFWLNWNLLFQFTSNIFFSFLFQPKFRPMKKPLLPTRISCFQGPISPSPPALNSNLPGGRGEIDDGTSGRSVSSSISSGFL